MSEKDLKELRSLFVKLKPIFLTDVYIYKCKYIMSGESSTILTIGKHLCILEEKYVKLLKEFYGDPTFLYIENLIKIKDDMNHFYEIRDNDKKQNQLLSFFSNESIYNSIFSEIGEIDDIKDWKNVVESFPDIKETLFKKKTNYTMEIEDGSDKIEIIVGKQVFPTVSEKGLDTIDYYISYSEEKTLYLLTFKIPSTHFVLYSKYYTLDMM